MFMGEYRHTVDPKGRVSMPAKFRSELGETFVISKGLDKCLFVYPEKEWHNLLEKLDGQSFTQSKERRMKRFLLSGAAVCEIDKQGRVNVPQRLWDYAGVDKNAVIIGLSTRLEIWNETLWDEYQESLDSDFENFDEAFGDFEL